MCGSLLMKHIHQRHETCLGAAIAMVLDDETLHDGYCRDGAKECWATVLLWTKRNAPWAFRTIDVMHQGAPPRADGETLCEEIASNGRGIIIMRRECGGVLTGRHALAYGDGEIHNPQHVDSIWPSIQGFYDWCEAGGWIIEAVIPYTEGGKRDEGNNPSNKRRNVPPKPRR